MPDVSAAVKRRPGRPRHLTPSADYLARKELIMRAAAEVFASKSYETATLDDVAASLDMRKASLYHYVESKADLVAELFARAFNSGMARLENAAQVSDPGERLVAIIRVFVDEMADHPGLVAAFAGHRPIFNDERDNQFKANDELMIEIVSAAVRDAVSAGLLPAVDVRCGAMAIIGMVSSVHKWFDRERDPAPADIADHFARLLSLKPS